MFIRSTLVEHHKTRLRKLIRRPYSPPAVAIHRPGSARHQWRLSAGVTGERPSSKTNGRAARVRPASRALSRPQSPRSPKQRPYKLWF